MEFTAQLEFRPNLEPKKATLCIFGKSTDRNVLCYKFDGTYLEVLNEYVSDWNKIPLETIYVLEKPVDNQV